jgi:hypothetical protein
VNKGIRKGWELPHPSLCLRHSALLRTGFLVSSGDDVPRLLVAPDVVGVWSRALPATSVAPVVIPSLYFSFLASMVFDDPKGSSVPSCASPGSGLVTITKLDPFFHAW